MRFFSNLTSTLLPRKLRSCVTYVPASKVSTLKMPKTNLTSMRSDLKQIFCAGLTSVKPHNLIRQKVQVHERNLVIDGVSYRLTSKVYLVGAGKAVLGMALEMERLLGDRLLKGIVSLPRGSVELDTANLANYMISRDKGTLIYRENCENNVADEATLATTKAIIELVEPLREEDTLIVLISGGSSALLSLPYPSLTLNEKNAFWKKLQNSGADIKEVNKVRQKLSLVKGGKFAQLAIPAKVISLVLSDVIGDPIDLIGSAPTYISNTDPLEIKSILDKYGFQQNALDQRIRALLNHNGACNQNGVDFHKYVTNIIIGNNLCAIEAAKREALKKGLKVLVVRNDIEGLVKNVSKMYVNLTKVICLFLDGKIAKRELLSALREAKNHTEIGDDVMDAILHFDNPSSNGLLMIGGGEPSVIVTGTGKGGRNQELALQFSQDWSTEAKKLSFLENFEVLFLSAGTDGQDGPTDAAGAFGYGEITRLEPKFTEYLRENDAYNFYERFNDGNDLLKTGFTGTNVMDLHFVYLRRRGRGNAC